MAEVATFKHGHTGYTHHKCRCSVCSKAASAYQREYRMRDPEQRRQYGIAWRAANPDKCREYHQRFAERYPDYKRNPETWRRYRGRHPERVRASRLASRERFREYRRKWRIENPDKERAYIRRYNQTPKARAGWARRRAREANAKGVASAEAISARVAYYGNKCWMCRTSPYEHLDHVIPLSRGGTNWPSNLRPSCTSCNTSKHNKLIKEMLDVA